MSFAHLRRYDVQANYGFVLSLVSVIPLLGAAWLASRNYQHELGQIVYGSKGIFLPAFLGCLILSAGPSAVGFWLGLSSADQRRNDRSARSWIAFFIGGGVLTLNLILLAAFLMLRLQQPM